MGCLVFGWVFGWVGWWVDGWDLPNVGVDVEEDVHGSDGFDGGVACDAGEKGACPLVRDAPETGEQVGGWVNGCMDRWVD